MTYPFLNLQVGVGQQGFWISKQFVSDSRDSGWSEFGQTGLTVFGIDSGIDLIVKIHKKNFQVIIAFRHSAFIASQSLFVPTNMVLKRCLSNIQQMSIVKQWAVYPNVHILINSKLRISCTTVSVERAVCQDSGVTNILAESLRRRTIGLQLLWLLCIVM